MEEPIYKTYKEKRKEFREKTNDSIYYFIIFIVSAVALVFLPLLSTTIGLEWALPQSSVEWVLYVFTRVCVSAINVVIAISFIKQAKVNIKDDPNYIEACRIMNEVKKTDVVHYVPRSPKKFLAKEYSVKMFNIFLSTALATVALTQAILAYDVATMLTYLVTIVMGVVAGLFKMLQHEAYWTEEYLDYAKKFEKEIKYANGANYIQGDNKECLTSETKSSEI